MKLIIKFKACVTAIKHVHTFSFDIDFNKKYIVISPKGNKSFLASGVLITL